MQKRNVSIAIFEILSIFIFYVLLNEMNILNNNMRLYVENESKMNIVADKLRQSSDDLTDFARAYVATNNKVFYEQYFKTLDIRNGKTGRPVMYNGTYWDLEKSVRDARHPEAKAKSLKSIISELNLTKEEEKKLTMSENNSNDLVNLEKRAFEAMAQTPSNQKFAVELLYSKEYYAAKHKIMNPIDEFITMTNNRIDRDLVEFENKINKNFYYFLTFSILFIILNIVIFIIIKSEQDSTILKFKNTEEKLNRTLNLFSKHVISTSTDTKGVITDATEHFCRVSGYTKEELIGQNHNIVRHPDNPDSIYKDMWETIQAGKVWRATVKSRSKTGKNFWENTSIIPNFDSKDNIIGYTAIRHDVTAEKVKEIFMANISHELRTPMNAIIGFSSILNRRQKQEQNKELSNQIYTSAKSLLNLINDILDLSKIEDANFSVEYFEFNAYDEILIFTKQFYALGHEKELNFKTHISENLKDTFNGDWERIKQIALNLISNAIKFTPKEGEVGFNMDYKDNMLIMKVSDNGIGMSKEVQERIFKPFEQADGATTRKYGGTGLGLSIAQSLVEIMDGKIELESAEGEGTLFTVTIPLEKRLQDISETETIYTSVKDKTNTLSGHILVVEDNKTNQMLIRMLIEEFGLSCDIANDGEEAVDIYCPNTHDLVLTDEDMPKLGGMELMKILRKKYQESCSAIIALTANAMSYDRERFLQAGMDGYVAKPIDEDELYFTLKNFL